MPKTGKTTLATQMPDSLLLAFERGYNALPGVIAQDITNWSEMRQIYKELKKPEVKEHFKSIIIDTVDIASACCQKYICNQKDIETLGDLGFGKGWTAFKDEFDEIFRGLTQMGYAVFFISHSKETTEKDEDGAEFTRIKPSLQSSACAIIENMADIYGYAHAVRTDEGSKVILTLRSKDGSVSCGGRFKYIAPNIDFNYDSLQKALIDAIDKEAAEHNGVYVTDEKNQLASIQPEYDFDAIKAAIQNSISTLMGQSQSNQTKIVAIIEKYLGKGKKLADCTPVQCEQMELVRIDLEELLGK